MPSPTNASSTAETGKIYIGTGGYSYAEWRETGFYPPDLRTEQMLPFYARRFPVTELNSTWYQMPQPESLERLIDQTPTGFLFAVKLHHSLSCEPDPAKISSLTAAFRYGLAPLIQAKRLAAVLLLFPDTFDRTLAHRQRLTSLLEHLAGLPLAVQFRHRSWETEKVSAEMEKRKVALVVYESPDLPERFPPIRPTAPRNLFYVRFPGRSSGGRHRRTHARAEHAYSREELQEWIEKRLLEMVRGTRHGFIFFTNHLGGMATRNAADLTDLADRYGLELGKFQR